MAIYAGRRWRRPLVHRRFLKSLRRYLSRLPRPANATIVVKNPSFSCIYQKNVVPLPLPDDEVTDINFTEDPHDNLDVVFSESGNDTYNDGENQIEINTITLTEDVNGAYTTTVTCSSEWLKLLPGVLVFDVPAGKGEAEIDCDIAPGKQLVVLIEGKGSVVFTSTAGKIKVQYDVVEQTHVVIYLQAEPTSSPAPKRAKNAVPGVAIKGITITPQGASTGVESIKPAAEGTHKYLNNGQLFILRDGKTYTAQGIEVK